MNLKETIQYEKSRMTPIRFVVNWIIAPTFAVLTVILLGTASVLMAIDEVKYLTVFIILLSVLGFLMVAMFVSIPFVRNREIAFEVATHDYDTSALEDEERYTFAFSDGSSVILEPTGVSVFDRYFHYSSLVVTTETSTHLNRIEVFISFILKGNVSMTEENGIDIQGFHLELTKELLRAIDQFRIPLSNPEVIEVLRKDQRKAFKRIYLTRHV
jgi:hypothetical protein